MATSAKVHGARGDEDLARAAVAGDGQAFAELYDRHEQRVYRFCVRLLGNPDDAADATQETFMRLLKRLPALEGRELNVIAYVLTAARHACYDTIEGRKRLELTGEEIEPSGAEPGAIDEDPERAALLATTRELAQRAHARLPARQREVLALRELRGPLLRGDRRGHGDQAQRGRPADLAGAHRARGARAGRCPGVGRRRNARLRPGAAAARARAG